MMSVLYVLKILYEEWSTIPPLLCYHSHSTTPLYHVPSPIALSARSIFCHRSIYSHLINHTYIRSAGGFCQRPLTRLRKLRPLNSRTIQGIDLTSTMGSLHPPSNHKKQKQCPTISVLSQCAAFTILLVTFRTTSVRPGQSTLSSLPPPPDHTEINDGGQAVSREDEYYRGEGYNEEYVHYDEI
jgi:hypothetical protein